MMCLLSCVAFSIKSNRMSYGFQTPIPVIQQMLALVDFAPNKLLEPTSGEGRIILAALEKWENIKYTSLEIDSNYCQIQRDLGIEVQCIDFVEWELVSHDLVLANLPHTPMEVGYKMMDRLGECCSRIIVIMPWLWLINSKKRWDKWKKHLKTAINLPRSTFPGSRIQTAIFDLDLSKTFSETVLF